MAGDTTADAAALQLAVQRRLTGAERIQIALDMSLFARDLAIAGLRQQHPEWTEHEARREYLRRSLPAHLDRVPLP